ncbi:hypothetical protein B0O99DRAFT_10273 [Bisporella sp. PMI_857]|nr:hypothetical protein B0O99DRAFT_10273 [Bisporella sp. PMI_857]
MLLDSVSIACRICGNLPALGQSPEQAAAVISTTILKEGQSDTFRLRPSPESPHAHKIIFHWINTLAFFPSKIHSEYCKSLGWLAEAMANPALSQIALYVTSVHIDTLQGRSKSPETLQHGHQAIKILNDVLKDPSQTTTEETISAVLLLGTVALIGEAEEVEAHLNGLQALVELRGGISTFKAEGCFLHMLCTTNHIYRLLSECLSNPTTVAETQTPTSSPAEVQKLPTLYPLYRSPLLKDFAVLCGYSESVAEKFMELGYLFDMLDVFTLRLAPEFRPQFEKLCTGICGSTERFAEYRHGL